MPTQAQLPANMTAQTAQTANPNKPVSPAEMNALASVPGAGTGVPQIQQTGTTGIQGGSTGIMSTGPITPQMQTMMNWSQAHPGMVGDINPLTGQPSAPGTLTAYNPTTGQTTTQAVPAAGSVPVARSGPGAPAALPASLSRQAPQPGVAAAYGGMQSAQMNPWAQWLHRGNAQLPAGFGGGEFGPEFATRNQYNPLGI